MLRAHPERIRMLEVFLTACERDHLTRIVGRLEMALGEKSRTLAVEDRIERLALRLDRDRLARVVDRLRRLLDADEVPMAA